MAYVYTAVGNKHRHKGFHIVVASGKFPPCFLTPQYMGIIAANMCAMCWV